MERILLGDRAVAKRCSLTSGLWSFRQRRPLTVQCSLSEGNLDLFSGLPDVMLLAAPLELETGMTDKFCPFDYAHRMLCVPHFRRVYHLMFGPD